MAGFVRGDAVRLVEKVARREEREGRSARAESGRGAGEEGRLEGLRKEGVFNAYIVE